MSSRHNRFRFCRLFCLLLCGAFIMNIRPALTAYADEGATIASGDLRNVVCETEEGYVLFTDTGELLDNDQAYCLQDGEGHVFWFRAMEGGILYCEEWFTLNPGNINTRYYYGPGGVAASGAVTLDGTIYLFDVDGHLLLNTERTIGGVTWVSNEYGYASVKQELPGGSDPEPDEVENSQGTGGNQQSDGNSQGTGGNQQSGGNSQGTGGNQQSGGNGQETGGNQQGNGNGQNVVPSGLATLDNGEIVFYENGSLCTNRILELNGEYYYFQENGFLLHGASVQITQATDSHTGRIRAKENGSLYHNEFYLDRDTNRAYYYGASFFEIRGLVPFPESYSYFYNDGHMARSEIVQWNGEYYLFGEKGELLTGLNYINGRMELSTQDGVYLGPLSQAGWNELNGERYYVRTDGDQNAVLVSDSIFVIEWKEYHFDENGKMLHDCLLGDLLLGHDGLQITSGFFELSQGVYYVNQETGRIVRNSSVTVDGIVYRIDEDGLVTADSQSEADSAPAASDSSDQTSASGETSADRKMSAADGTDGNTDKDPDEGWTPVNETDKQLLSQLGAAELLTFQRLISANASTLSTGTGSSNTTTADRKNTENAVSGTKETQTSDITKARSYDKQNTETDRSGPSSHAGASRPQSRSGNNKGPAMAETESYTIPEEPGVYRMERGRWTPCRTNNGIPISVQFSGEGNRAFFQHSGIPLRNMLVVYPDSGGSLGMVAFDAGGNAEWFKGLGYIQIQALLVRENSVCILRSCRQDVL